MRSLPARYPPMPDAIIWVTVIQTMVDTQNVDALTPLLAQGETDDKPKPVPSSNSIKDKVAAATAPANIAAHDIALVFLCIELKPASGKTCVRVNSSVLDKLAVLDTLESAMIKLHSFMSGEYCTHAYEVLFDGVH